VDDDVVEVVGMTDDDVAASCAIPFETVETVTQLDEAGVEYAA
jgi:hypothetical protein